MPFITIADLGTHIGVQQIRALNLQPQEFEAAERAAAMRIVELAGIVEPDDPREAPEWVRQPAAYLVFNAFVPRLRAPELITWASERERAAVALLRSRRSKANSDSSDGAGSVHGHIKGLPSW